MQRPRVSSSFPPTVPRPARRNLWRINLDRARGRGWGAPGPRAGRGAVVSCRGGGGKRTNDDNRRQLQRGRCRDTGWGSIRSWSDAYARQGPVKANYSQPSKISPRPAGGKQWGTAVSVSQSSATGSRRGCAKSAAGWQTPIGDALTRPMLRPWRRGDRLAPSAPTTKAAGTAAGRQRPSRPVPATRRAAAARAAAARRSSDLKTRPRVRQGGRGDQSFNASACRRRGGERRPRHRHGPSPEREPEPRERLTQLADAGRQPDHRGRLRLRDASTKVAGGVPGHQLRDRRGAVDRGRKNVPACCSPLTGLLPRRCRRRADDQDHHVGFVGGVARRSSRRSRPATRPASRRSSPAIKIESSRLAQSGISGFNNPAEGKTAARASTRRCRHRLPRRRPLRLGVFKAAAAASKLAIGVDSDQYKISAPRPEAVHPDLGARARRQRGDDFIDDYVDGKTHAGHRRLSDLKSDGVGCSTSGGPLDDIKSKIDDYKDKIISGDIKVPNELLT